MIILYLQNFYSIERLLYLIVRHQIYMFKMQKKYRFKIMLSVCIPYSCLFVQQHIVHNSNTKSYGKITKEYLNRLRSFIEKKRSSCIVENLCASIVLGQLHCLFCCFINALIYKAIQEFQKSLIQCISLESKLTTNKMLIEKVFVR